MHLNTPEIQDLLAAARKYLEGGIGLPELHGYIGQCEYASAIQQDKALSEAVHEWRQMLNQTWNEWGINKNALPESEFKLWVQTQVDDWS